MLQSKTLQSKQFSINQILAYFVVICIILSSDTMYTLIEGWPLKTSYFKMALCVFCLISVIASKTIYSKSIIWITCLGIYFLIYSLFTDISRSFILYTVIPLLCLFLYIYTLIRNQQLYYLTTAFVYIVTVEAVISLVFYLLGTQLAALPGQKSITYFWADKSRPASTYFYIYFSNPAQMETVFSHSLMRNTGIFPEAPGHAGLLTYAMVFAVANLKRNPARFKKILVVLTVTMISVFSTKGFVSLLIFLAGWYLLSIKENSRIKYLGFVALVVCIICLAWFLIADRSGSHSFLVRVEDLTAELKAWRDNLFFGVGYSGTDQILQYATSGIKTTEGLSMGMTIMLAKGGIYLFSFYVVAAIKYLRTKWFLKEMKEGLLILAVLAWNFFISDCGFTMSFLIFVCIALCVKREPTNKKLEQMQDYQDIFTNKSVPRYSI